MNILFLTDILPSGGNRTYILSASQAFRDAGHQVFLIGFCANQSHDLPTTHFTKVHTIRVKSFRAPFLITRLVALRRTLSELLVVTKVDCLIVDLIDPAASLLTVKFFLKDLLRHTQIVYQFHGLPSMEMRYTGHDESAPRSLSSQLRTMKHWLRLNFDRWVLSSLPDEIIAFSEYSKRILLDAGVTAPIVCVKPGIDAPLSLAARGLSRAKARKRLGFSLHHQLILIASRLEARKGVLSFFRAFADVKLRYSNCTFLMVSDFWNDPETHEFYQVLAEQQLGTKVFAISRPTRAEMAILYHAADVTVVPSLDLETLGLVSLESMKLGTPVVSFAIGANPELITAARLAQPADYRQLQRKVLKLLTASISDRKKIQRSMAEKMTEYDWKNYIAHFTKKPQNDGRPAQRIKS